MATYYKPQNYSKSRKSCSGRVLLSDIGRALKIAEWGDQIDVTVKSNRHNGSGKTACIIANKLLNLQVIWPLIVNYLAFIINHWDYKGLNCLSRLSVLNLFSKVEEVLKTGLENISSFTREQICVGKLHKSVKMKVNRSVAKWEQNKMEMLHMSLSSLIIMKILSVMSLIVYFSRTEWSLFSDFL